MYYREYSVKKFAKGGNLAGITEKDFANNRVIKKGNIEIELSKDYPTEYYAHFIDMSKEGGELISVYANKNWNKVVKEIESFKYAKGGNVDNEGDLLLNDGKHISEDVLEILRKYDDDIAEKNINGLRKLKQELRKIGYTIEIKSTGEIIDLRAIGQKGYNSGRMDEGGSIMDYNDDVYDNDYDNEDESDSVYEIHFKPEDKEQSYQIYDKLEGLYVAGFSNEKGAIDWFNKNKGYYSYSKGGEMAKGGDLRYKIKGKNFDEQIKNNGEYKKLINKVDASQNEDNKFQKNFIDETARTGKIVKYKNEYYLKDYSYTGDLTSFPFLNDKDFLEAIKYLDRPTIKTIK